MAGLAGLLGGYGSDDDEEQQQQDSGDDAPPLAGILGAAPSGSLSPTAAATAAAAAPQHAGSSAGTGSNQHDTAGPNQQQQQQQQQPLRILEGPSTNPEPPPEGLSPPMARELDSNMGSEAAEDALPAALYGLPAELREPPAGDPDPVLQAALDRFLGWVRSGRSVMAELRKDRRWHNPKFLTKTVEYFGLQQYGTCLDPEVWDPAAIPQEDLWPALQEQLESRKRRRGAEVKFQSAGQQQQQAQQMPAQAQLPPAGPPGAAAAAAAASAAAAVVAAAVASQPGAAAAAGGAAPKVVSIDPRAAAAQAQALANSLAAGAKKSKWDK